MHKQDVKNLSNFMMAYVRQDERILDVGCGIGDNISLLKSLGYKQIIGIDISKEMVDITKAKGHEAYVIDEAFFDDIDVLLFSHVLEHIGYPEIKHMMEHYFKMCKSNAKVIVIMPVLYDAFFNDVDHIKPYYPDGLMTLFSNKVVSKQYKSQNALKLLDIEYRKESWIPYNMKSRYIKTTKNKLIFKFVSIFMGIVKAISFNIISKTTGYTAIFSLHRETK